MNILKMLFRSMKPALNKPVVSSSVIELGNEARLMKENAAKLKAVVDEWLKVLEDGNKKYAEMEDARKHCY